MKSKQRRHPRRRPSEPTILDSVFGGAFEMGADVANPNRRIPPPEKRPPGRVVRRTGERTKGVEDLRVSEEEEEEREGRINIPFFYGSIPIGRRKKERPPLSPEAELERSRTEQEQYRSEAERYKAVTAKHQKGVASHERRRASHERRRVHAEMGTSPMGMAREYLERRAEAKQEKLRAKTARYEKKTAELYRRMAPSRIANISVQQYPGRTEAEIRHAATPRPPALVRRPSEFSRLEDEG
jgi:hypothetical protein